MPAADSRATTPGTPALAPDAVQVPLGFGPRASASSDHQLQRLSRAEPRPLRLAFPPAPPTFSLARPAPFPRVPSRSRRPAGS